MKIQALNALGTQEMCQQLMGSCHCNGWAHRVTSEAPFSSMKNLMSVCLEQWNEATEKEMLEAFSGHPQIGDMEALRNKYAETAGQEQGQIVGADETILMLLAERNDDYLRKFGFIFIVCASSKSAAEMLGLLEARINNTRETELANGAREQALIMKLRLGKTFED
jgi:2-oxo-4-hydroxy-4-carboxy-5-ureidoimidazoline decarboxylase